jgi:pimeloyl-ACP methyl ester carboxylesterase
LPYVEHNGNRTFYSRLDSADARETGAIPIILHHGMAQWGEDWAKAGWLDAFGNRAVYALDALGHGRSDRPTDRAAYSMENRAATVLKLADTERIDRFVFFGFSMGGRVGFELTASSSSRVERLVVGGMHGLEPAIDRQNLERRIAVLRSDKWRMVERAVGARAGDGRNNDQGALALSTEAVLDWRGAESRLPGFNLPVLVYCGQQDSILEYAKSTADLLSNCTFTELRGIGHAASFYTSEAARRHVQTFLSLNPPS